MRLHTGEGDLTAVAYPRDIIDGVVRVAEADPTREVCGFVVRRPGGELALEPVANRADPREAQSRFVMDAAEQLRVVRDVERRGGVIVAIFHSHLGGGARLSSTDRDEAIVAGAALWPDVEQIVVGLRGGRLDEIRRYRFAHGEFEEYPLD